MALVGQMLIMNLIGFVFRVTQVLIEQHRFC